MDSPTDRTPFCLVVRGPLGAGKTTVAHAVARRLGAHVVSVDDILEKHHLEIWDTRRDRVALASFLRANAIIARTVRSELGAGRSVVVEGNFYWREAVADLRRRVGRSVRILRLDAPLATCLNRDRGRPAPESGTTPQAGQRMGPTAVRKVFRYTRAVRVGRSIDARGSVERVVERVLGEIGRA